MNILYSIVIPVNLDDLNIYKLEKLLKSINNFDGEIILVNDMADLKIEEIAVKYNCKIIDSPYPGASCARNTGAKNSKGEYIIFLDSDIILKENAISIIKSYINNGKKVICGEYDIQPANPCISTKFKSTLAYYWRPKEKRSTVFLTRIGAIKKDLFLSLGGFDENIKGASVEEWEFGRRLSEKETIYYDSNILVYHHFKPFYKELWVLFKRTYAWIGIGKDFDNTCTTKLMGVIQLIGLATLLFPFLIILYFFINIQFFRIAYNNFGLLNAIIFIPMLFMSSIVITMGAIMGIIKEVVRVLRIFWMSIGRQF